MKNNSTIAHKEKSLKIVNEYLDNLINYDEKKANLLFYWLEDYIRYLKMEENFKPNLLKRYERGDIIKVNLGFNVGSEEGGLHYCVVVDNHNERNSPVITVIPLSSVKNAKTVRNKYQIELGNQLYEKMLLKANTLKKYCHNKIKDINIELDEIENKNQKPSKEKINFLETEIEKLEEEYAQLEKIVKEIDKMKQGSIALINQITTISKQRIYNPKTNYDILSGIKLSPNNLDKINDKIVELYIKQKS